MMAVILDLHYWLTNSINIINLAKISQSSEAHHANQYIRSQE